MIVIHGDRVESLAGAIVGSVNNILVTHIEGGELSGTIDELIRHSTSKLSHLHFVSNRIAKERLIQMGEIADSIFVIGSPDIDIMFSKKLPNLKEVKSYYQIPFEKYALVMFHPVTTEMKNIEKHVKNFVSALLDDSHNYIIIFPNNDLGSSVILKGYERLKNNSRFKIFPSLRFEYFLTLLKNAQFIIGNSSAGVREAPYYSLPIINIGTRQKNRDIQADIINTNYSKKEISKSLKKIDKYRVIKTSNNFGKGNSAKLFLKLLLKKTVWKLNHQKQFQDL